MLRMTQQPEGAPLDIPRWRNFLTAMAARVPDGVAVLRTEVSGCVVDWLVPDGADTSARILYLHGGGYVGGSAHTHRALAARVAQAAGCAALIMDYRLAPENPFPAAFEDVLAVLDYVAQIGPDGAYGDARKLFIVGDSAGGGLALAALLELRGRLRVDAAVTMSAWTDLACTGESHTTRLTAERYLAPHLMLPTADAYLAGWEPRDPRASPLYGDPTGLPPLLMQVGDSEILLDDTLRFAGKARASGVDVTCQVWPEMVHVFQAFAAILPEAQQAIADAGEFLKRHS
jgi:monoterpene epsilon-lactone hydrolase